MARLKRSLIRNSAEVRCWRSATESCCFLRSSSLAGKLGFRRTSFASSNHLSKLSLRPEAFNTDTVEPYDDDTESAAPRRSPSSAIFKLDRDFVPSVII